MPLRRYGTKDELADLALFLCADAAAYITGASTCAMAAPRSRAAAWPRSRREPRTASLLRQLGVYQRDRAGGFQHDRHRYLHHHRIFWRETWEPAWLLLPIWVFGAICSLAGAFCYSELGINFPSSGGEYVYLTEAFGPDLGLHDRLGLFLRRLLSADRPCGTGVSRLTSATFFQRCSSRPRRPCSDRAIGSFGSGARRLTAS